MKPFAIANATRVIAITFLVFSTGPVLASEGGSSFYLLGQRGSNAAVMPAVEGVFFSLPTYFYSGDVSGSQPLEIGGAATLGLDADVFLTMPTALWITPVDMLGANLGFSGTFVYGKSDISADVAIALPEIGNLGVNRSDDRWAVGDPVFSAFLAWQNGNSYYTLTPSVNVPVGDYDVGRLSNTSLNRWAGDITAAGTWLFPENKIELSGAAGFTFNGENDKTDYETGNEFHAEAAAFYQFTQIFSAGVNGYYYKQLSGDSGDGAVLGNLKGRVAALGPGMSANFMAGEIPVSVGFRYYHEFNAAKRLEGDAGWLTVFIPLWVPQSN